MVSEAGASVYSVSKVAAEELPKLSASERGAVVTMSPATSTVTFFRGSPRRVANKLRNKVAAIVEANPWLAARLDDDEDGEMCLFVPPELPELFAVRHDIAVERTPYASLVEALAPVLCGTSLEVRGTAKPLFQVSLVSCASTCWCCSGRALRCA